MPALPPAKIQVGQVWRVMHGDWAADHLVVSVHNGQYVLGGETHARHAVPPLNDDGTPATLIGHAVVVPVKE